MRFRFEKKGEVSEGMTWFFAFIVVIFIIMGLAAIVITLNTQRQLSFSNLFSFGNKNQGFDISPSLVYDLQRDSIIFANLNDVSSLVGSGSDLDKQEFNKESKAFLDNFVSAYPNNGFSNGWIRIYGLDENTNVESKIYQNYGSIIGNGKCVTDSSSSVNTKIFYSSFKMEVCLTISS